MTSKATCVFRWLLKKNDLCEAEYVDRNRIFVGISENPLYFVVATCFKGDVT